MDYGNLELSSPSSIAEFVKKLYSMLEDQTIPDSIVCWGSDGDTFIVKDPSDFASLILPRHFKHNNFASFVRQLNKYGFKKCKPGPERIHGSAAWEFIHSKFRKDHKNLLQQIKRKLPNPKIKLAAGNRRSSRPRAATARAAKQSQSQQSSEAESDDNNDDQAETIQRLQQDIESLRQSNTDLSDRLQILTNEHDRVLGQVALLRNRVDEQQRIIEEFIAMISSQQNGTVPPANTISTLASVNVAGASQMLQHLQHHSHGHHDGNTPPIGNGHGPDHLHDHVHGHDHDSEHAIMKQAEVQRHRADDYGAFPPALTPDTPSPTYPYASNHQYSIHAANLAYQQFQIKQEESRGLTPPLSASSSISRQNSSLSPSSQQYQQQYDNLNILNSPATSQSDRDDSPFGNVDMIDASATIVPSQV